MCVCVLRVLARFRDAGAGGMVILQMVTVASGSRSARTLFWEFSMERFPWHLAVCWMLRMVLCLGSSQSRQKLNVVFEPGTSDRNSETLLACESCTVFSEHFVLHDREIDTPTLSPECQ